MMAVTPSTKPILAILEPTTLLMAIAGDPDKAAFKLTNNSGADVAKETTVIPITIFEIESLKDKATEDFTKKSPPIIRETKPKIKKAILIINYFVRRYNFSYVICLAIRINSIKQ